MLRLPTFFHPCFLFFCFWIFGCQIHSQELGRDEKVAEEQVQLFKDIFVQPALTQQKLVQRIRNFPLDLPDTLKANEWNILGICFAIQGKLDSAIVSFDQSISFLTEKDRQYSGFLVNKASVLRNMNRIEDGMVVLIRAEDVAKQQGDKVALSKVYGEMAACYGLIRNQELAIQFISKSIFLLQGSDSVSTRSRHVEKQKLANYFINEANWTAAKEVLEEIMPYFQAQQLEDKYLLSLLSYTECLLQLKLWKEAESSLKNLLEGLERFQNPYWLSLAELKMARLHVYFERNQLADVWFQKTIQRVFDRPAHYSLSVCIEYLRFLNQTNQFVKAMALASRIDESQILSISPEWDQAIYFELLSETEAGLQHFNAAFELLKRGKSLMDDIKERYNRTNLYMIQSHFENHLLQQQKRVLSQELELKQSNLIITALALFISLALLLYGLYTYRLRRKIFHQELKMAAAEKQLLQDKLKFEELVSSEKAKVIEIQKNEILGNALQIALLNEELNSFKSEFKDEQSDVAIKFKDFNPGSKSLQILLEKLQLANPIFFDTLKTKFPFLSKADIEFCSMVEIGLSYKDIAALLQISHESAISKKYRITRKLNLVGVEDFQAWLKEVSRTSINE